MTKNSLRISARKNAVGIDKRSKPPRATLARALTSVPRGADIQQHPRLQNVGNGVNIYAKGYWNAQEYLGICTRVEYRKGLRRLCVDKNDSSNKRSLSELSSAWVYV